MTQPTGITPKFFTKVAIRGTLWNYLSFTAGKLLNFITTMILARLLLPEQFGLVGYCTIAIQYIDILNTAGINNALIARKDKIEEASNAAIVINICMGVISFGIAWMIAPLIADFFNAPEVTNLFRVLSVVLVIDGFGLVPDTLIQRSLRFQTMVIPNVSRTFAKGATSIVLALLGWGPWSLIWGQIAGEIVAVILCWILVNWHPTWKFDWQVTKELMQYGSHIIIIGFAGAIHSNVDYIIVGRVLGSAALGYYTMAYRLPELAIGSFNSVVSGVLFPLLSRTQSDIEALRKFYFRYVRYLSLITFAIGTGLMLVAKLFVEDFLSNKWEPTIFPMSLIAIALAISSTGYAPGVLYKSINRPEILSRLSLIKLPLIIALLIVCSRWGINGIAAGQVVFALFTFSLDSFVVSRIVKFKFSQLVEALAPAFISSCVMAIFVTLIQRLFDPSGWVGLIVLIVSGGLSYIITLLVVSRETVREILSLIRKEKSIA